MYWMWFLVGFVLGFFLAALFNVGLLSCTLLGLLVGAGCYLCAEADDKASKKGDE
jgi:mannose/fructose/N-acetylgalactosamine-specific phosphotransferase system component IIC